MILQKSIDTISSVCYFFGIILTVILFAQLCTDAAHKQLCLVEISVNVIIVLICLLRFL